MSNLKMKKLNSLKYKLHFVWLKLFTSLLGVTRAREPISHLLISSFHGIQYLASLAMLGAITISSELHSVGRFAKYDTQRARY